jgi:hypothetical protein
MPSLGSGPRLLAMQVLRHDQAEPEGGGGKGNSGLRVGTGPSPSPSPSPRAWPSRCCGVARKAEAEGSLASRSGAEGSLASQNGAEGSLASRSGEARPEPAPALHAAVWQVALKTQPQLPPNRSPNDPHPTPSLAPS